MASTKADQRFQDLADKVSLIDVRQKEVFQPSLKRIEVVLQTIEQRDYISREEAERKFVTKDDFAFIKRIVYGVITAVLLGFVSLFFYLIQVGLSK